GDRRRARVPRRARRQLPGARCQDRQGAVAIPDGIRRRCATGRLRGGRRAVRRHRYRRQSAPGQRVWRRRVGLLAEGTARAAMATAATSHGRRADRTDRERCRYGADGRDQRGIQLRAGPWAREERGDGERRQRGRPAARRYRMAEGRVGHRRPSERRPEVDHVQPARRLLLHLPAAPLDVRAGHRGRVTLVVLAVLVAVVWLAPAEPATAAELTAPPAAGLQPLITTSELVVRRNRFALPL